MADTQKYFNPFPGLRPFEPEEDYLFFGRDGQSDELLKRLRRTRFLAVVGTSGSGKSSLVRAGLLPALYGGLMARAGSRWRVAVLRPGDDPIGNLASALNAPEVFGSNNEQSDIGETSIETTLRRGALGLIEVARQNKMPAGDNLLIVVDQFEELFRFKQVLQRPEAGDEAAAFVKLLLEAVKQDELRIYVIITMRSDYLGDCAQFRDLPETINDSQYLIPRMTRDQRREAITGPIAVGGAEISLRLVQRLLNDVGDNPDQLPILQHALMRTWDHWQANHKNSVPLDLPDYEEIGGMATALSHHANEAYGELAQGIDEETGQRRQQIAEKMFKFLTEKGADNREIRRPSKLVDIAAVAEASEEEVIAVLEVFRKPGRSFLMPPIGEKLTSQTLIDISHESLIRNWDKLKIWVDEEARSAYTYRRLAETAVLHEKGEAGLWGDPDLRFALHWRQQSRPNKTWSKRYHPKYDLAMAFLDKSKAAEKARRKKRQWKRILAVAAVATVMFAFAIWQWWLSDALTIRKLQAPLNALRAGEISVSEFDKKLTDVQEQVRDRRRLAGERQAFISVLLDSIEIAALWNGDGARAEAYLPMLLRQLPMPDTTLRQQKIDKVAKDYYDRVQQPGIGLTPAIYDTMKTWLAVAAQAYDQDAIIKALLTDLESHHEILSAVRIKAPADQRFLVGDVRSRNQDVRLKVVLENPDKLQSAAVYLNDKPMSLEGFDGEKFWSGVLRFSTDSFSSDSAEVDVPIRAMTKDSIEVSRSFIFDIKKLRRAAPDKVYNNAAVSGDSLSVPDIVLMFRDFDFNDTNFNPDGAGYTNHFFLGKERFVLEKDSLVVDCATGLMWQRSGSKEEKTYDEAKEYIAELNHQKFGDYSDWRLPTLEEAMSLMERQRSALYIHPIFDEEQSWIWTADLYSASYAWNVYFDYGRCYDGNVYYNYYVRAVR